MNHTCSGVNMDTTCTFEQYSGDM